MKKLLVSLCCFMLCVSLVAGFSGCGSLFPVARATDLMKDVKANTITGKNADNRFTGQLAALSAELFKRSAAEGENTLVSPLSVALALAMTANGAGGKTLQQMSELLGGDIPLDELNEYFYGYVKALPSEPKSKLGIANSIWFRDDENRLKVEKDFLQINADYYNAGAYKAPFDDSTVKAINSWVDDKTDGMIDSIIDNIFEDTVMYLINAIVFDAEWEKVYNKESISDGVFNAYDGTKQNVRMMFSEESTYLDDGMATGFIKNYSGGNYSFAALLPNDGIDVDDYISSLSGSGNSHHLKRCADSHRQRHDAEVFVRLQACNEQPLNRYGNDRRLFLIGSRFRQDGDVVARQHLCGRGSSQSVYFRRRAGHQSGSRDKGRDERRDGRD